MTMQKVTPSEETNSPDEAGCLEFQKVKALAAGALELRALKAAVHAVLLQGNLGGLAGHPEPPCDPPQPEDCMQRRAVSALDSLLALLPSLLALLPTVLQEHQQPAVRSETAQGWSVTSQETADCRAQAGAAVVQMASLLVPQAPVMRKVLADAQALGLLSARRRACMRYWADHTPAQATYVVNGVNECIFMAVCSVCKCL